MGNPLVAILIATKNGSKHLFEQLTSIQNQVDVTPTIYISDDASSDETLKVVDEFGILQSNINNGTHGSAAKNFFQMIINHEVSIDEKFVFLSDQDDIWLPKKCIRAIELMRRNGADAYSGSYIFSVALDLVLLLHFNEIRFWLCKTYCVPKENIWKV